MRYGIGGEPVRHGAQGERRGADLDLQADVAKRAPVQRLENFLATRRLPGVAPPRDLAAAVKGPAAALVGEVRGEIRERLLFAQQLCPRGVPRQAQRLGIVQPDHAARAAGHREMRERRGQRRGVEHQVHGGVRGQRQRRPLLQQRLPRRRHWRAAGEKRIGEFLRRALLEHRHHPRHQAVRAGGVAAVLQPLGLEEQVRGRPRRIVKLGRVPAGRDQFRHAVLEIAEVALEGRVVILEAVRGVDGDLPRLVRAQVGEDGPARSCSAPSSTKPPV